MSRHTPNGMTRMISLAPRLLLCLLALCIITAGSATSILAVFPQPSAPLNFTNVSIESPLPQTSANYSIAGGTISTIQISSDTQNPHWKGFVGNITGTYSLRDASNFTLFNWNLTTISGEIYATRSTLIPNWEIVRCANSSSIYDEEQALGFTNSSVDRINFTFSTGSHSAFYVGITPISANSCPRVTTYVNGESQSAQFQQVLLYDENALLYVSLINSTQKGFDNNDYHFQMILPDYGDVAIEGQVAYYFYVELI